MRIINISLSLLLVLSSFSARSETAITERLGSEPESREDYRVAETTQTPEATNVRSRNPETDSPNDVTEPQISGELEDSMSPITQIMKRCARVGSARSPNREPILSLARRDVTERRIQQCETCRNRKACRERNRCASCRNMCSGIPTTTPPPENPDNPTPRAEEKREVTDPPPSNTQEVILTSRFMGNDASDVPKYYSLASVEAGPVMSLLEKLFNIPTHFEKYIVLGKMKGAQERRNVDDVIIIDLAQAFGNNKKIQANVHRLGKNDKISTDVIDDLNKKLDEAIQRRLGETGNSQLSKDEVQKVIDEAFRDRTDDVGKAREESSDNNETATRCSVDEAVEDLLNVMPYNNAAHPKVKPYPEEKPQVQPQVYPIDESSEEEFKNPPVIQDNYDVGASLKDKTVDATPKDNIIGDAAEEGFIDDNEEARPIVVTENKGSDSVVPLQDAKKATQKETDDRKDVVGDTAEVVGVSDNEKPTLSSDNQMNEPKLQEGVNTDGLVGESRPGGLGKSIVQIVEDSLKTGSSGQNIFQTVEGALSPSSAAQMNGPRLREGANTDGNLIGESRPGGLGKGIVQIVEDSLKTASSGQNVLPNIGTPSQRPSAVHMNAPRLREGLNTDENVGESRAGDLESNIAQIVEDSLKTASSGQNVLPNIGTLSQRPSAVQMNAPRLREGLNTDDSVGESRAGDLESNIVQIVEDSIKAVSSQRPEDSLVEQKYALSGPVVEEEPQQMFVEEKVKPSQANSKNVVKVVQDPRVKQAQESESADSTQDNVQLESTNMEENAAAPDSPAIVKMPPSEFESRAQFPGNEDGREQSNYFGALVPAKDTQFGVTDPKMKKVFYVGENINLPLKMFQDENGVMKLRVDTDALCNCKNQNCTKPHLEDRFRNAETESKDDNLPLLPRLQVRFGDDSHKNEQLMDSFVDSLHSHDENLDVFKRSPKHFDDDEEIRSLENEKLELENEIVKLNEDIEKYNQANKELLNKGTVALFKDVEKTKDVDRMITLANNLLSWMKDFAMKNLES